ncbi:DUF7344 domain-containing protein [Haladaptatus cibarius]|uniref:DUF7344 domain-containing protein n=1 Tax=Haladaptatus cibarius TaxID=453847 RepID=UPI0006784B77|nr:hypothetical protein [Haladaptatus cibarius]
MSVSSDSSPVDEFESAVEDRPEPLSRDKIFHILQTQRRRDALRYLKDTDGPIEMRDLAEQVAAWENDTTVRKLSSNERQRVYIALYQSHLPKLDNEGIIDYNKSRGIVERGPLADQFDPYLNAPGEVTDENKTDEDTRDGSDDTELPWLRYYRRLTAVGIALVSSAWVGVRPFSLVPDLVWGALLVSAFGALSLAQILTGDS